MPGHFDSAMCSCVVCWSSCSPFFLVVCTSSLVLADLLVAGAFLFSFRCADVCFFVPLHVSCCLRDIVPSVSVFGVFVAACVIVIALCDAFCDGNIFVRDLVLYFAA